LYFFEQGSNAEYVSPDRELFYLLHDRLYERQPKAIEVNEEIGGHSSVWAIRAQHENCRVYVTPSPSDFNIENLRRKDLNNGEDLVLPIEHMDAPDTAIRNKDVHLVFEYVKGD